MRCGHCGKKEFKLKNIKGMKFAWKDYYQVEVRVDRKFNACKNCGQVKFMYKDHAKLDKAIVESINVHQKNCIEHLSSKGITQIKLAQILGFTPQYISELKSGKKQMSFGMFSLMSIFKDDPGLIKQYTGVDATLRGDDGEQWNNLFNKIDLTGLEEQILRELLKEGAPKATRNSSINIYSSKMVEVREAC